MAPQPWEGETLEHQAGPWLLRTSRLFPTAVQETGGLAEALPAVPSYHLEHFLPPKKPPRVPLRQPPMPLEALATCPMQVKTLQDCGRFENESHLSLTSP